MFFLQVSSGVTVVAYYCVWLTKKIIIYMKMRGSMDYNFKVCYKLNDRASNKKYSYVRIPVYADSIKCEIKCQTIPSWYQGWVKLWKERIFANSILKFMDDGDTSSNNNLLAVLLMVSWTIMGGFRIMITLSPARMRDARHHVSAHCDINPSRARGPKFKHPSRSIPEF